MSDSIYIKLIIKMYSYMDWDGLKPKKWRDKGRKKFE